MLVVVEHGDVELVDQTALDLEAARRGDVLEVDAAEAGGEALDGLDDLVDVLRVKAQRDGVHAAEGLEQRALALHDGHGRSRADVAQAEHGRAVGDDGHGVCLHGVLVRIGRILSDLAARLGDAGGVGQRQVLARFDPHLRDGFQLALPLLMQTQRFLRDIHAAPCTFPYARRRRRRLT